VLARVRHGEVQLVQTAQLGRTVLGADRGPAEVDLGHRVDGASDVGHVRGGRVALLAAPEIVDLDAAAIGRDQRPLAGHERDAGPRAESELRGRQGDELAHEVGPQAHAGPLDGRPAGHQPRAGPRGRQGHPRFGEHTEGRRVDPLEIGGREDR